MGDGPTQRSQSSVPGTGGVSVGRAMPRGEMSGFGEQEQADLLDVGAGGDVDVIFFFVCIEGVVFCECVERSEDFFKIPGIPENAVVLEDFGFRGDLANVRTDLFGQ